MKDVLVKQLLKAWKNFINSKKKKNKFVSIFFSPSTLKAC